MEGRRIQVKKPHENGDVEQRHHRLKRALDQALLLRGSREFATREEYEDFLSHLLEQLNSGRQARLQEELKVLNGLPKGRLESCKRVKVRVKKGSTIRVDNNLLPFTTVQAQMATPTGAPETIRLSMSLTKTC